MNITLQKPGFLPGLEFFSAVSQSDICILLDSELMRKRDSATRTSILGPGGPETVVVPVKRSGGHGQTIKDTLLDNAPHCRKKLLKKLYHFYRQSRYCEEIYPFLESTINRGWVSLADMNIALITVIANRLQLPCTFRLSSGFSNHTPTSDIVADMVHTLHGKTVRPGASLRPFVEEEAFTARGVTIVPPEFEHPHYPQLSDRFFPGLSIVDALFNCGQQGVHTLLNG